MTLAGPYFCEKCGTFSTRGFKSIQGLHNHMSRVHGRGTGRVHAVLSVSLNDDLVAELDALGGNRSAHVRNAIEAYIKGRRG